MNTLPIRNPREQKALTVLERRVAVLENALSRLNFMGCDQCGELYPGSYRDFVQTRDGGHSNGHVCLECLTNDEDALEDREITPHELNRHLNQWQSGWMPWATKDGERVLSGGSVQYMLEFRPTTFAPKYWQPSCVLWDFAESQNIKVDQFFDPRQFHWDGQLLRLKFPVHA